MLTFAIFATLILLKCCKVNTDVIIFHPKHQKESLKISTFSYMTRITISSLTILKIIPLYNRISRSYSRFSNCSPNIFTAALFMCCFVVCFFILDYLTIHLLKPHHLDLSACFLRAVWVVSSSHPIPFI